MATTHHNTEDANLAAEVARLRAALARREAQGRILAEIAGDYAYGFRRTPSGDDPGWFTPGFAALTGFTPEEMARRGWETLAYPDDRPLLRERAAAIAAGAAFEREYRILTKLGDTRWIHDALRVAEPDDTGVVWVYGAARDITDAKRAEATAARLVTQVRAAQREAAASERRLREVFMQVPAAIAVYKGPEHIVEFVNAAYERLSGRTAAQVVGKPVRATLAAVPADAPVFQLLDRTYTGGETVAAPAFPMWYDGDGDGASEEAFYDMTYHPLRDAADRTRGVLVHAVEVTEQVRGRDALRAERDRLQQVLDALPEAVLIADTAPRFTVSNRAAAAILGVDAVGYPVPVSAEIAYGSRHLDGSPYPARELPLQRALRGDTVRGEQLLLENAQSGASVPVLANAVPLVDAAGAMAGAVVVFQDISDVLEGERTREEFISTTAHDLKGPLTSVRGYTQLAARRLGRLTGVETASIASALGSIEDATVRMVGLINDLADATRIRMGVPLELRRAPTDLVALVRGVVAGQVFAGEPVTVDAETPELIAEVDAPRFERVLTNLIGNAIKYGSPDAPITIRVWREADAEAGATGAGGAVAAVSVADRGVGIPVEDLPTIWDRYTRGGNVSGHIVGSGLGLASVRAIIERHGGTVAAESAAGEGSTFTVRVPLREVTGNR